MFLNFSFIRLTEDTYNSKLNVLPFVIYQVDRRHFRLESKCSSICHLPGRQKTLPTRNLIIFYLSFIKPTEDSSDSKLNVLPFVIDQANRRHFRLELNALPFVIDQADRKHFRLEIKLFSICHLSGRQKTLTIQN